MKLWLSFPAFLSLLAGCRTSAPASEPVLSPATPAVAWVYRARMEDVPSGARDVRLTVPLPPDPADPAGKRVRRVCAAVLVGNASFEIPLEASVKAGALPAGVTSTVLETPGTLMRTLRIETRGKPIELELLFDLEALEQPGNAALAAEDVQRALTPNIRAEVDGQPWTAISTGWRHAPIR